MVNRSLAMIKMDLGHLNKSLLNSVLTSKQCVIDGYLFLVEFLWYKSQTLYYYRFHTHQYNQQALHLYNKDSESGRKCYKVHLFSNLIEARLMQA